MPAGKLMLFWVGFVVSVDCGRRHPPFVAVNRLADFCDFAMAFKLIGAIPIAESSLCYRYGWTSNRATDRGSRFCA